MMVAQLSGVDLQKVRKIAHGRYSGRFDYSHGVMLGMITQTPRVRLTANLPDCRFLHFQSFRTFWC